MGNINIKKITLLISCLCLGLLGTPAEARKKTEQEKQEEKYQKWLKQQDEWKRNVELNCPVGGYDEVIIDPELGRMSYLVKGGRVARFIRDRTKGLVEVINTHAVTIRHIKEGGRVLIENMCPNGQVTLVATLPFFAGSVILGRATYSQDFFWSATGLIDNHLYFARSDPLSLYVNQWQNEMKAVWLIEFSDVDRKLPPHPEGR